MSVRVIIFSKNRACQLDALLQSLRNNAIMHPIGTQPIVLWAATGEHPVGYAHAMDDWPDVRFVLERDFAADVDRLLPGDGHVMFLVDDDLLFHHVNLAHPVWELERDPGLIAFSLRLGANTTHCFPLARDQRMPDFAQDASGVLVWDWPTADADMGYAGSLDGHVFRAADVREWIDGQTFHSPNTLEEILSRRVMAHANTMPRMASYHRSALVGVPANVVNNTHPNRTTNGPDAATLNARYRAGERIVPALMDFSRVNAAHCAVPYVFSTEKIAA